MVKVHEFDPVIYPYKLWVIVDKTPEVIPTIFTEYSGDKIEFIERDTKMTQAFVMPVIHIESNRYGVVMFFRSKSTMTFELVAHEASHAAKYLFTHVNASIDEHEPFEYVIGWIAKCCEKVKKNKTV